jgi:hypothetical protein
MAAGAHPADDGMSSQAAVDNTSGSGKLSGLGQKRVKHMVDDAADSYTSHGK